MGSQIWRYFGHGSIVIKIESKVKLKWFDTMLSGIELLY